MEHRPISTDPLSGLLNRLCNAEWLTGISSFPSPWAIEVPADYLSFYVVTAGETQLWLAERDRQPVTVRTGSYVLLTHGTSHRVYDQASSPQRPWKEAFYRSPAERHQPINGSGVTMVHGHFPLASLGRSRFDELLPALVQLDTTTAPMLASVAPMLELSRHEQRAAVAGWQTVVGQIVKTLFVQAIRSLVLSNRGDANDAEHSNLFHATLDVAIGPVLAVLHDCPEKPWTVTTLARRAHMARSAFSERFRQAVGQPPLKYLTEYRIHKACRLLRDTQLGVKEIAVTVGYESASSFSNAFKRWVGLAPADYRKRGRVVDGVNDHLQKPHRISSDRARRPRNGFHSRTHAG